MDPECSNVAEIVRLSVVLANEANFCKTSSLGERWPKVAAFFTASECDGNFGENSP